MLLKVALGTMIAGLLSVSVFRALHLIECWRTEAGQHAVYAGYMRAAYEDKGEKAPLVCPMTAPREKLKALRRIVVGDDAIEGLFDARPSTVRSYYLQNIVSTKIWTGDGPPPEWLLGSDAQAGDPGRPYPVTVSRVGFSLDGTEAFFVLYRPTSCSSGLPVAMVRTPSGWKMKEPDLSWFSRK